MKKTKLGHMALGFPPEGGHASATMRLACFLCTVVQAPGGALAWVLLGMAQGDTWCLGSLLRADMQAPRCAWFASSAI
jgi:hypothetical protein